jgi:hypothetical protein
MANAGTQQEQFEDTMELKRAEMKQARELAMEQISATTKAALARATGKGSGGTDLDTVATSLYNRYRLLQDQGKYTHPYGSPEGRVAAQEILVRAYKEAAEILGKGGEAKARPFGLPPAAGGAAPARSYEGFSSVEEG